MLKLILAGFKGVGKTTTGRLVAQMLDLPFFDTDELLVDHYKKPIGEIYQELSEDRFRETEAKMLEDLKKQKKVVIALGGGTLLSKKAQELAPSMGSLVYLYSSPETLMQRLNTQSAFLDPKDPHSSFKKVFEKRHPVFCKVCKYRIDVDSLSPNEIATTILDFYG